MPLKKTPWDIINSIDKKYFSYVLSWAAKGSAILICGELVVETNVGTHHAGADKVINHGAVRVIAFIQISQAHFVLTFVCIGVGTIFHTVAAGVHVERLTRVE